MKFCKNRLKLIINLALYENLVKAKKYNKRGYHFQFFL
jgi:hypothetical protein